MVTEFASRVERVFSLKILLDESLEKKYDKAKVKSIVSEMDGLLSQIQDSSEKTGRLLLKVEKLDGTRYCDWFPCDWDKSGRIGKAWAKYNSNNRGSTEIVKAINQQMSNLRSELGNFQKEIESGKPVSRKFKINWDKVWNVAKCVGGIIIGLYGGITGNEPVLGIGETLIQNAC